MILRNVGNYLHKDTTLRHRRRESPTVIKSNVMFVFRAVARAMTRSVKHTWRFLSYVPRQVLDFSWVRQNYGFYIMKNGLAQLVEVLWYKQQERVRSPEVSLEFFINLNLPVAQWPCDRLRFLQKISTRNIFWALRAIGAWGWQHYHLHVPTA